MSIENQSDPKRNFTPRFLPWIAGLAMLAVYVVTLNPWITLSNLGHVSNISGFVWQPQLYSPLLYLVTLPFRWLPTAQIPLALNIFSAVCAALSLVLLARCVALLPHDRTEAERCRERSGFSFLTGWVAWFPPVLAVVLLGLQLTFWEHATSFTGEMLDLLVFAVVVWQLLEYRLDEAEWRLELAALVYGVGIAENWAFIGFFPVFIAAIIWLKGLRFFNVRFLVRMALRGFIGMLLLLLLPVIANFSSIYSIGIWEGLKPVLSLDWMVLKTLKSSDMRYSLALMSLTTLLPLLVMAIRWSASFGDNSRIGVALAGQMFHAIFGVIFGVCVWVMFDPQISPRQTGVAPSLTLYFLAALSIGYYCGYFLLVFGKKAVPTRRNKRPEPALPAGLTWLSPVIVAGTFVAALMAIGTLAYKNAPIISKFNDRTLFNYATHVTQNLPAGGAILLCDSESAAQPQPVRSLLVQAMLAREGRAKDYPVVDTQSLKWAPYHRFLHARHPDKLPLIVEAKENGELHPLRLVFMLDSMSKSNTLCYLNPSFGYFFEQFYQEAHGMVYLLKPLPSENLLPPLADAKLTAENEAFWAKVLPMITPGITNALPPQQKETPIPANIAERLLLKLHVLPERNRNAAVAGTFYSRCLNHWGVQLQRAGDLTNSTAYFDAAFALNPQNVAAAFNYDFNQVLRTSPDNLTISPVSTDQFGQFRNWNELLNACGPFDDLNFCLENGALLFQGGLIRQSAAPIARARQLVPNNLHIRLFLAQIYLFANKPDAAMEVLNDPIKQPTRFSLNETNSTGLSLLLSAVHFQKNEFQRGSEILETEIARHPEDEMLVTTTVQAYFSRGLYTNALKVIDRKLAKTPDATPWIFGKGYAHVQTGENDKAIAAFTRVLEMQTNDPAARFSRALAYLNSERLADARNDYSVLQAVHTNSFQVAYGLAEVAWRQKDTNEVIRNYNIYLANAPTNSVEIPIVRDRLKQLRGN